MLIVRISNKGFTYPDKEGAVMYHYKLARKRQQNPSGVAGSDMVVWYKGLAMADAVNSLIKQKKICKHFVEMWYGETKVVGLGLE